MTDHRYANVNVSGDPAGYRWGAKVWRTRMSRKALLRGTSLYHETRTKFDVQADGPAFANRMIDSAAYDSQRHMLATHKASPADAIVSLVHACAWHQLYSDNYGGRAGGSLNTNKTAHHQWPLAGHGSLVPPYGPREHIELESLPTELLLQILEFLDVDDVLVMSRTSHYLRALSLAPILHKHRRQQIRIILPPLLFSPARPTYTELQARLIVISRTIAISRKLGRALASIRLARRLLARPSPETLVERSVLFPAKVAPGLVAKQRAVERERLKDGLRRWVGSVLEHKVREKGAGIKLLEERAGVGRVWRLRRHWERIARGEALKR